MNYYLNVYYKIIKMKELPEKLNPRNLPHFKDYQQTRDLCYFRRDIYEFLLHSDFDRDYFDTVQFFEKYKIKDENVKKNMINIMIAEIQKLGWHVGIVFNQTTILIYPTKEELETCFWSTSIDFKCL